MGDLRFVLWRATVCSFPWAASACSYQACSLGNIIIEWWLSLISKQGSAPDFGLCFGRTFVGSGTAVVRSVPV